MGRKHWVAMTAVVLGAGLLGAGHVYASTPKPAVAIAPAMTLSRTAITPSVLAQSTTHGEKSPRVHEGKGNATITVRRAGAGHLIVRWLCEGTGTITIHPTAGTTWSSPCAAGWGSMFTGDAQSASGTDSIRVTAPAASHWRLAVSQL